MSVLFMLSEIGMGGHYFNLQSTMLGIDHSVVCSYMANAKHNN